MGQSIYMLKSTLANRLSWLIQDTTDNQVPFLQVLVALNKPLWNWYPTEKVNYNIYNNHFYSTSLIVYQTQLH